MHNIKFRVEKKEWTICSKSTMTAYLATIGTRMEYRNQGLGTRLLERIKSHLQSLGCDYLELHVLASNLNAINFYKSNGFTIKDFMPGFYFFNEGYHDAYSLTWRALEVKENSEGRERNMCSKMLAFLMRILPFNRAKYVKLHDSDR
jgi:ribosomal protein S18 acetylase RimI-like enzyme